MVIGYGEQDKYLEILTQCDPPQSVISIKGHHHVYGGDASQSKCNFCKIDL